ncbi:MAG: elongation factor 1-beta [Candidatus Nanohaloarchaea archaeon]|nr:elongation factor 1-beta [Candidatus Nanohaloarchaea archaeon]
MGEVAVVLKVMPEDAETDLERIDDAIRDSIEVEDLQHEEVAFGLKALKVSTIVSDDEGGTDTVENSVSGIDGVRSVEVEDMQRL